MLTNIPAKGFYYHYKHDPAKSLNNYAYEVVGVGHHTEEEGVYFVVYRPLYEEARVYQEGKLFDIRPLVMFMEEVARPARLSGGGDDKTFPRFSPLTDPKIIAELEAIKNKMYE